MGRLREVLIQKDARDSLNCFVGQGLDVQASKEASPIDFFGAGKCVWIAFDTEKLDRRLSREVAAHDRALLDAVVGKVLQISAALPSGRLAQKRDQTDPH